MIRPNLPKSVGPRQWFQHCQNTGPPLAHSKGPIHIPGLAEFKCQTELYAELACMVSAPKTRASDTQSVASSSLV